MFRTLASFEFRKSADNEYDQSHDVELKIERLDAFENDDQHFYVGDEHQPPERKRKSNFVEGHPPQYVKLTSRKNKAAPTKIFQLINPGTNLPATAIRLDEAEPSNGTNGRPVIENENTVVLKQLATVCDRFADPEFGYGMHVAQQLRQLPMQNRETVRHKINTLLYDELTLGAGNNVRQKNKELKFSTYIPYS